MNVLWRAAGMKCFVRSYRVYPTAERAGFIEALPNALPVREAGEFAEVLEEHRARAGVDDVDVWLGATTIATPALVYEQTMAHEMVEPGLCAA